MVTYSILVAVAGYLLVGDEVYSWKGALIAILLVWGGVEVWVGLAALKESVSGWSWSSALHATLAFGAVVAGVLVAGSWHWIALAAFVISAAWLYSRVAPEDEDAD